MKFESELLNETDLDREVEIDDSVATIKSEIEQKVDCDTFMEMFKNKVNKQRELSRKVRDMENSIDELLNNQSEDMQFMHAIDESQPQSDMPEKVQRGNAVNAVSLDSIGSYVKLRQAKDRLDNSREQLADVEEDLMHLKDAAQEIVETYDSFEMPNNFELAMEDIEGSDE